jgi:predicted nucleic acid-binding Zn ribbon protein
MTTLTIPAKQCAICTTAFIPASNRAKYCSDDCRANSRASATCERCAVEFNVKSGASGRFCSAACWFAFNEATTERTQCTVCGREFKRVGQQQACGAECAAVLRRRRDRRACERCDAEFEVKRSSAQRFCSRKCALTGAGMNPGGRAAAVPVGTTRPTTNGYVTIKTDHGWAAQHRQVLADHIGRPLLPTETVHHKDGNRANNTIDNLELRVGRHGRGATQAHCATCRCFEH